MGLFSVSKDTKATNQANREINQQNIDASYEMLRRQQEYADKQWQRDTEYNERYNSPSAQMDRYRAAGLNPYMMMGNGIQNTNVAQSMSGGSGSVPASIPMQNPANEKIGRAQALSGSIKSLNDSIQNLSLRRNMDADSNLKNSQAENINLGNQFVAQKARQDIAESVSRVKRNQVQNDRDNFNIQYGMQMLPYDLQKAQNDVRLQNLNETLLEIHVDMDRARLPFVSEQAAADLAETIASAQEKRAHAEELRSLGKLHDADEVLKHAYKDIADLKFKMDNIPQWQREKLQRYAVAKALKDATDNFNHGFNFSNLLNGFDGNYSPNSY